MDMCIGRDEPPPSSQDVIGRRVRTLAFEAGARPSDHGFARMFPLAGPAARLPEGPQTLAALTRLAAAMVETPEQAAAEAPRARSPGDSEIPAGYTYLAEFVLNDMVWERAVMAAVEDGADFRPLDALDGLLNRHSGRLDLDSVYDAPRDPAAIRRMLLGAVAPGPGDAAAAAPWPVRKCATNDLPRHERDARPGRDRAARTADPRNDERLVLNQLHVAFLKAHNALVAGGLSFEAARRALRQRYQWLVLFDLLERLCDRATLAEVKAHGGRALAGRHGQFVPVEFSAAAFVLGPAMRRASYDYNPLHRNVESTLLATRYCLGFAGRGPQALPAERIIAWEGFLPLEGEAPQRARRINTTLSGAPQATAAIATHHLLRGYRLGLPTGQAAALSLGMTPLEGNTLLAALPESQRAAAVPFAHATPLWFYILAEAGHPDGPNGAHLGALGTRIVASTLIALIRQSDGSILSPDAGADFGHFTLTDLILLADEEDRAAAGEGRA